MDDRSMCILRWREALLYVYVNTSIGRAHRIRYRIGYSLKNFTSKVYIIIPVLPTLPILHAQGNETGQKRNHRSPHSLIPATASLSFQANHTPPNV